MRNKRGIVTMIKAIEDTKTGQQTRTVIDVKTRPVQIGFAAHNGLRVLR